MMNHCSGWIRGRNGFAEKTVHIPVYGMLLSKAEMCLPEHDPRLTLRNSLTLI